MSYMKLIFIRHGDPNYEDDCLTAKGRREAQLLAQRVAAWNVNEFHASPLGRAYETASICLDEYRMAKKNPPEAKEMFVHDWLKEFYFPVTDPISGRHGVPWDFVPSFWTNEAAFFDRKAWPDAPVMQQSPELKEKYLEVCDSTDKLLARHGYIRTDNHYRVAGKEAVYVQETAAPGSTHADFNPGTNETVLVFFAHFGIICVLLSHLLSIPFPLLSCGMFLAPSSVTILGTEERWGVEASFRIQVAGDTTHLFGGAEAISCAGAYYSVFQEHK